MSNSQGMDMDKIMNYCLALQQLISNQVSNCLVSENILYWNVLTGYRVISYRGPTKQ